MRVHFLFLCLGALAPTGCSFVTSVDGLRGNGDGGSTADSGISGLCTGTDVVYCNDFDHGSINAQELQTNGGGSAVLDGTDAYSKPQSLLFRATGAGPHGAAFVYDGGASTPSSLRLEFRVRVAASAADQVQLAVLRIGTPPAARTFTLVVETGGAASLHLDESDGTTTTPHPLASTAVLDGAWHQATLALDSGTAVVTFDGAAPQSIATKWSPRSVSVYVGARQFSLATTSVRIDDVVIHASL